MNRQDNDDLLKLQSIQSISNREREVLQLASLGFKSKEIAMRLNISESTVETHKVNIFKKLRVENITAAVAMAIRNGVI